MKSPLNAPTPFATDAFAAAPGPGRWLHRPVLLFILLFLGAVTRVQSAQTLIPVGAMWRYLDTGVDQGVLWRQTNFDDSTWAIGPAELGFGDGGEAHIINGGPSGSRFPTIYFRRSFDVANRASLTNLALRLLRDDGGVVHLNGTEVFRINMPEGPVVHGTWSAVSVSGSEESAFFAAAIPPGLLVDGPNVIAVEIHQSDAGSSDLSFNFELLANTPLGNLPPVGTVSLTPSSQIVGANEVFTVSATASDPETSVVHLDVNQDGAVIHAASGDFTSFDWSHATPGIHDYTVRATDLTGMMGVSPAARILVTPPGLQAQSVFFPQFPSSAGLILQNAALINSNVLHLNRGTGGNRGGAWMATQQGVLEGFVSEFRFRITSKGDGGADGFAFIIAGTPQAALGSSSLSYSGITNSLAVEFDTWQNSSESDPDDLHIGVHSGGTLANSVNESASLGRVSPAADFSDGAVHRVRIEYVPGTLNVFLDNFFTPALTVNVDLNTLLHLPTGRAWIGMAGGTGASWENHDIFTWSYISFANLPPTVSLTSPAQAIRVAPGTDVTLTATASDPNGSILGVDFFDSTMWLGRVTSAPYSLVWTNPPPGIHVITAAATDNDGLDVSSAPIVIEVIPANAELILLPDFTNTSSLILQGSAAASTNRIRMTPALGSQAGGFWLNSRQLVEHGFETVFQYQISQLSSKGADGFAFVILDAAGPVLGSAGDDLGYSSLPGSLAVEFDTFQNPEAADPDDNHIGVHSRGTAPNSSNESASLARANPPFNISDGAIHTVVIRYKSGLLSVFVDETSLPVLELPLDLGTLLNLSNRPVWVGFTSSTGGEFEAHDLLMWSFRPNHPPLVQFAPGPGPFVAPTNLVLSADASDSDGEIATVEFFVNGTSLASATGAPYTAAWSNAPAGTYLLSVKATDDWGGFTTTSAVVRLFQIPQLRPLILQSNGTPALEFVTIPGHHYTVQYSADLVNWSNAVPTLTGNGAAMQWSDPGPPVTDSPPSAQPHRFYRMSVSP